MTRSRKRKTPDELLKAETGFVRDLGPVEYYLVSAIAIAWAVFQLSLPSFFIIASTKERAIHLAFAMTLLFLVCPFLKKTGKAPRAISPKGRVPLIDWLLALSGALTALYLAVNFEDIAMPAVHRRPSISCPAPSSSCCSSKQREGRWDRPFPSLPFFLRSTPFLAPTCRTSWHSREFP